MSAPEPETDDPLLEDGQQMDETMMAEMND